MPTLSTRRRTALALAAAAVVSSCNGGGGDDIVQPPPPPAAPRVLTAAVTPNPNSALSGVVAVTAENAESVRVVYWAEGEPQDSTPYQRITGGSGTVVTLGLRAETAYHHQVEVAGAGGVGRSDTLAFTSGPLPDIVQRIAITTTGTGGPGLILTALQIGGQGLVAFAFDSAGTIRWYRRFDDPGAGGELKQQRNGNFTIYVGSSFGSQPVKGHFVEFSPAGDSLRTFIAPSPRYTDNHELWITTGPDGAERIHLFSYDHRTTDLTFLGGPSNAALAGHQLQRLLADGTVEFLFDGWDNFRVEDWIEPPRPGPVDPDEPDFDHPNSMEFDLDGNYIVSWRNLGEVSKIDAQSGALIWRLGGVNNQFTFVNDPLNGFSAQHSARVMANGNILIYDNGWRHEPQESRAVEYALDHVAKTATLVWQFRRNPIIYTPFVGSVQRLANGNTVIGYGQAGHVSEVAPDGSQVWEADVKAEGQVGFTYRLLRIKSLYRSEAP